LSTVVLAIEVICLINIADHVENGIITVDNNNCNPFFCFQA